MTSTHRDPRQTAAAGWLLALTITSAAAADAPKTQPTVPVDLYVMSYCPWGVRAENVILPAVKSLAPHVELRVRFIADAQPSPDGDATKMRFTSMHGDAEVQEDLRQVCAEKHFPQQYLDYILERNKNVSDQNWQAVATRTGMTPSVLEQCSAGPEGIALLDENLKAHTARKANASPTIDIDGAPFTGPRGPRAVTLALCQALKTKGVESPEACAKAEALPPDPVPTASGCGATPNEGGGQPAPILGPLAGIGPSTTSVEIRVVHDTACPICRPKLADALSRVFPAAHITMISSDSAEGRQLLEQLQPQSLPLYVFDKSIEQSPNFPQLRQILIRRHGDYVIRPELSLPNVWLARQRIPHHLDVFVNSLAPSTPRVEAELMQFFETTTAKDLTFSLHFITQEGVSDQHMPNIAKGAKTLRAAAMGELHSHTDGPLVSGGGPQELAESLRELCLFQHGSMGDFFTYLTCLRQAFQNPKQAEACLAASKTVARCISGQEGQQLLREDARLERSLGITAGPVLLWENRFGPVGFYEIKSLDGLVSAEMHGSGPPQ